MDDKRKRRKIFLSLHAFRQFRQHSSLRNHSQKRCKGSFMGGKIGSFVSTDDQRLDGLENCTCLSVSFPNYKMLYKKTNEDPVSPMALLEIYVESFLNVDSTSLAFFATNAAKGHNRYNPITEEEFLDHCTLKWAQGMFYESWQSCCRAGNIPDLYTTDPQAEILFKGKIPFDCVRRILVKDAWAQKVISDIEGIPAEIDKGLFSPRCDYQHWKKG